MARYYGAVAVLYSVAACCAEAPEELLKAHRYPELAAHVNARSPMLQRGAVASAFGATKQAEKLLRETIRSAPRTDDAYEAYEQLAHIYLRTGQYAKLITAMEARWAAFPGKPEEAREKSVIAAFRGLPNQRTVQRLHSHVPHKGDLFVGLTINGVASSYFFDTGAAVSCMSDSEAKRFGLEVRDGGTLGMSTGKRTGFRVAIAREVRIGKLVFQDVSFAVFPDEVEPWKSLEPGRRGLIGRPILLEFGRLRWTKAGLLEIGYPTKLIGTPNLYWDQDAPVLIASFQGKPARVTLDTGAETTDLYLGFAQQFPKVVEQLGSKSTKEVNGVGTTETFESVTIPELRFGIGSYQATLRPANVLMKQIGSKCCVGNVGIDLLEQGSAFGIDFERMHVWIEH